MMRPMLAMRAAQSAGNENLDGLAGQLLPFRAEQTLGLRIHINNAPASIDDHHRVGSGVEHREEISGKNGHVFVQRSSGFSDGLLDSTPWTSVLDVRTRRGAVPRGDRNPWGAALRLTRNTLPT